MKGEGEEGQGGRKRSMSFAERALLASGASSSDEAKRFSGRAGGGTDGPDGAAATEPGTQRACATRIPGRARQTRSTRSHVPENTGPYTYISKQTPSCLA